MVVNDHAELRLVSSPVEVQGSGFGLLTSNRPSVPVDFDPADAIHHASYAECERLASFDDRGFARRAKRLGLVPAVFVPR